MFWKTYVMIYTTLLCLVISSATGMEDKRAFQMKRVLALPPNKRFFGLGITALNYLNKLAQETGAAEALGLDDELDSFTELANSAASGDISGTLDSFGDLTGLDLAGKRAFPDLRGEKRAFLAGKRAFPDLRGEKRAFLADKRAFPDLRGEKRAFLADKKAFPDLRGEKRAFFFEKRAFPDLRGEKRAFPDLRGEKRAFPDLRGEKRAFPDLRGEKRAFPDLRGDKRAYMMDKRNKPSSCTAKYAAMKASTMCDYEDDPSATETFVSEADKSAILDTHNKLRSGVNPPSSNMQKMYWDDEIAKIAQKWANTCPNGHDTNDQRKVPGYNIWVGQNYAMGFPDWRSAVEAWYSEVNDFKYGPDPDTYLGPGGWAKVGHYTQVVRDASGKVGCGFAQCSSPIYVCNYAYGNPLDFGHPYESGSSCSQCPGSCSDGLCDCGGKICKNDGTLDISTCTCQCTELYAGEECENTNCPPSDADYCGQPQPYGFPKEFCDIYSNVPTECPHMCGMCSKRK